MIICFIRPISYNGTCCKIDYPVRRGFEDPGNMFEVPIPFGILTFWIFQSWSGGYVFENHFNGKVYASHHSNKMQ